MKKSAAAIGVAIAAISLTVGVGCSKTTKTSTTSTSTSTSTSTPTSTATTTSTSAQATGPNETIDDYLKNNNIQVTAVSHDTPGAPTIDLPVPDGWSQLPESADAPYGGIQLNGSDPEKPTRIAASLDKLTGNVDTDKLLATTPGELKNEPGYEGGDGERSTLAGFPAYQVGGDGTSKSGKKIVVAEKAVVIQGKDGVYLLRLAAGGLEADSSALMDATNQIDEKTSITP